jgi:copper(I)-binding protein
MRGLLPITFAFIVGLTAPMATLWADGVGGIVIERPWARASIMKSRPAVAYLTIRNEGSSADRLVRVTSSLAGSVTIHSSGMTDGVMKMRAMRHLEITQGGRTALKPGGMHLMLMDLREPLRKGERLSLTLEFEHAGRLELSMPILSPTAKGPGGAGD